MRSVTMIAESKIGLSGIVMQVDRLMRRPADRVGLARTGGMLDR